MSANIEHCKNICNAPSENRPKNEPPLDTLAQLATSEDSDDISLCNNTRVDDKKNLLKRARRNYFSTSLSLSLVSAAEQNKDSILKKSYWNTYHCNAVLLLRNSGKITGKYCKNRWCMVCNAIRTARSITDYVPVIQSWKDSHLLTLTVPNCTAENLPLCIEQIHTCFRLIRKSVHKQFSRGKCKYKLIGIRKFECTYNAVCNTYHPHFHVILKSKDMAERIYSEWLERNTDCSRKAQDIRKADTKSLQELFKYMTKVISNTGKEKVIYADALDVIFNAMRGKRVLQNFGFKLPKGLDPFKQEKDESLVMSIYQWQQEAADWVNVDDGDMLTGYTPGDTFKELVNTKILARNTAS